VRRETGKEYGVKVSDDKDLASHIDPKPCVATREGRGEASVGACAGRPLSLENSLLGADSVVQAEGETASFDSARTTLTWRGRRPRHVQKFLVWEPGDLGVDPHIEWRSVSGRRFASSR
jgi:hypothetical protein